MEKDHYRSRNSNNRGNAASGGFRGRGNAQGSISYAEFVRKGGSKARNERKEKEAKYDTAYVGGKVDGFAEKHSKNLEQFGRKRDEMINGRQRRNKRFDDNHQNGVKKFERGAKFNSNESVSNFNSNERKVKRQTQPTYEKTQFVDYSKPMRLNRFLANAGVCSRREADTFIQAGVVTVNGNVVIELGSRVVPDRDRVLFHGELVKIERRVYILLNKPKDYVTTAEDVHAKKTVLDLVKGACAERIYPVGRLDRNTTGVLLLTNDGELTSKLTHPSFNRKKIYQVTLDHDVTDEDVKKITHGIVLEDGEIKVDEFNFIKEEDRKNVGVEIHSGRNRIVRRIFESLGYKVMRLDRVYFAGLTKKNLPRGKWRFLSEKEVVFLKMNINNQTENC